MGSLASHSGTHVLPEILSFADKKILLVHGTEKGKDFWWPPGSYWLAEKACDLTNEQPNDWVSRVMRAQVNIEPHSIRLRGVEFIDPRHPAVLLFEVELAGCPQPSPAYSFDDARYFHIESLPGNLGRDMRHADWLKGIISRFAQAA